MIDLEQIKRKIIIAFFNDDDLMEMFVLKGGNALALIHPGFSRASYDIDFSMPGDIENIDKIKEKISNSLVSTLREIECVPFDLKLEKRPDVLRTGQPPFWGGYECTFKVMEKDRFEKLGDNIEQLRREAIKFPGKEGKDSPKFSIDISKHEYCDEKQDIYLDDYLIWVYTPALIVMEKLRAICQQNPRYQAITFSSITPRPRDFYDIYTVHSSTEEMQIATDILKDVFEIKKVPLEYLQEIADQFRFHQTAEESLKSTLPASEEYKGFEFYFNYVLELVRSFGDI